MQEGVEVQAVRGKNRNCLDDITWTSVSNTVSVGIVADVARAITVRVWYPLQ